MAARSSMNRISGVHFIIRYTLDNYKCRIFFLISALINVFRHFWDFSAVLRTILSTRDQLSIGQ